jgi:hypothetical protein
VVLTRLLACALVLVVVGCGGGGEEPRAAKAVPSPTTTPTDTKPDTRVPEDALLGIVRPWNGSGSLVAPVDRRTLEPGTPWVDLGEYHDTWSLSPDRRLAAFGISAPGRQRRIGIRVIDLGTFLVVRDIEAGIVAEAVGWIAPDRLAAFLQSGELVVVDPRGGQELARQALGLSCPSAVPDAVTPLGYVMLLSVGGAARLVLADAQGGVRTRELRRIAAGETFGLCAGASLAIDQERLVAYVVGAHAPVAEIDLRTMRVRNHRIASAPRLLTVRGCQGCGADLGAAWLGGGRLAVAGHHQRTSGPIRRRVRPAGAIVVDTRNWTARTIARRAGAVLRAGDDLLVYDGRHPSVRPRRGGGLAVFDRAGRHRYTVLRGERVGDVQVAGTRAYARTARGLRVVDLRRGRVVARLPRERRDVDLIAPR